MLWAAWEIQIGELPGKIRNVQKTAICYFGCNANIFCYSRCLMHNILQCNWFSPRPAALRKPVQAPVHGFQVWRFVFYFLLTAVFFVVYGSAQGSSACAAVWQCGSVSSVLQRVAL